MLFCAGFFASVAPSYASTRDHDIPGKLMGMGGASGVVDDATNPADVYAVQLNFNEPVTFTVTHPQGNPIAANLYAPGLPAITDLFGSGWVAGNSQGMFGTSFTLPYTPAVTGVYYLRVFSIGGYTSTYQLSVSGSAGMPSGETEWAAGVASGYSKSPVFGTKTRLHATLSPSFNANARMLASAVEFQESTNTVNWTTKETIATEGVVDRDVAPTTQRWYRFYYAGDGGYAGKTSSWVRISPRPYVSSVAFGSSTLYRQKTRSFRGYVNPKTWVSLKVYKRSTVTKKYYPYKTVKASVSSTKSWEGHKFTAKWKPTSKGRYRVRWQTGAPTNMSSSTSAYKYLTVK
jgi:hypothetical protein